MAKLDLKKQFAHLYKASAKAPAMVDVPAMNFLMVDGAGDPNTAPGFQAAIETLYGLSYTLKFGLKKRGGTDYTVMGLEGLWWAEGKESGAAFIAGERDKWKWTLMIMQPDFVTAAMVEEAREELRRRSPRRPAIDRARLERLQEGLSAQVLHVGPYSEEHATVERLHAFIAEGGYRLAGKHHEMYMNDPRRTAPAKLKTILRQPVGKQ